MKSIAAVVALSALANESRLSVFRLLVEAGPQGIAAGVLAERLGTTPSALSFHLKDLSHAGLIAARREGRYVFYSTDFAAMNALLSYLTENCCGGRSCAPRVSTAKKPAMKSASKPNSKPVARPAPSHSSTAPHNPRL